MGRSARRTTAPPDARPGAAAGVRARVERAARQAALHVPAGEVLRVNKTALDALDCDGRYLDLRDQPLQWSERLLAGKLAHRAIELDRAGGYQRPVGDVVTHAWMEAATDRGWPRTTSPTWPASPPTACAGRSPSG